MEVSDLLPVGITLVVVTIALAFGLQIVGSVKTDLGEDICSRNTAAQGQTYNTSMGQCQNSTGALRDVGNAEFNATGDGISGLSKLTGKLPTIGLVLAAVVIIGILVKGFGNAGA
jgi:hypothetical protein